MEISAVAKSAFDLFDEGSRSTSIIGVDRLFLCGYFAGVMEGRITVGDRRVGDILLDKFSDSATGDVARTLHELFSSGMANEGQPLKGLAQKALGTWAGRNG